MSLGRTIQVFSGAIEWGDESEIFVVLWGENIEWVLPYGRRFQVFVSKDVVDENESFIVSQFKTFIENYILKLFSPKILSRF